MSPPIEGQIQGGRQRARCANNHCALRVPFAPF